MSHPSSPRFTAFRGHQRLAAGSLREAAMALWRAQRDDASAAPLLFSDDTGQQVELDLRGTQAEVAARYPEVPPAPPARGAPAEPQARPRGRPKLGVVAREVTLLPEQWEWLARQPGGASVALRKLVHDARRASEQRDRGRRAQERTYAFMSALAGNLPGFEEATRALFAGDTGKLARLIADWPVDVRDHVMRLADPGEPEPAARA